MRFKLFVVFLVMFQYLVSSEVVLTKQEKDFIKTHPVITLGGGESFDPFLIKNKDGSVSGYDAEIVKLINKKTNLNIQFRLDNWKKIQDDAKSRKLDGISTSLDTKERRKLYNPSLPYINVTPLVVVKKGNPKNIKNIKQLNGKTVALQEGNLYQKKLLGSLENIKTVYYKSMHELIKSVVSNSADFAIIDETAFYIAGQIGLESMIETPFSIGEPQSFVFNLRNDMPELVSIVNKGLNAISPKEFRTLKKEWFGENKQATIPFSKEEKEYLEKIKTIKISSETNWEPFDYVDSNGVSKGYSIDYMKLIAKKIGVEVEFIQSDDWAELTRLFCEKKIDVLHPIDSVYATKCGDIIKSSHINDTVTFATRKGFKNIENIDDLYGLKVAVQKGWEVSDWFIKTYSEKVKIISVDSTIDGLKLVAKGDADVVMDLTSVFSYLLSKYGFYSIQTSGTFKEIGVFNLSIAVREDTPLLYSIIQKVKEHILPHEILTLQEKWFGKNSLNSTLNQINYTTEEKNYLKEKKDIKMCIDPDWLPFSKLEGDKHYGIGADIYKIIKEKIPVPISTVKTKNWYETLEFAKEKKCDIVEFAIKTPSREKYLNFTSSFLEIPLIIVTGFDVPFIYDFKTLENKKVAIPKGYAFIELLKNKYPNLNIIEVDNISNGLQSVKDKEVFGYIGTLASVAHVLKKDFTGELKVAGRFEEKFNMGSAVRDDDIVLLQILQKVIDSIPQEEIDNIVSKWINIKYEKEFDYGVLWKVLIFISIVLVFIFYRQYELNKRIKLEVEKSREKDNLIFQQNKMATLGEMVGNIAHQWRQPLAQVSMIQNYLLSQLTIHKKSLPDDVFEEIHNSQNILQFMSKTIDTFQNLYINENSEEFFLDRSIENVLNVFDASINLNDIKIIKEFDNDLLLVGDSNSFSQVVFAIIHNSVFFLNLRDIDEPRIVIFIEKSDEKISIKISDNAGGIDEDVLPYIFDYGYSKRDGEQSSTGIGLYIAKLIVKNKFNGEICALNSGSGAQFIIDLYT